AKPGGEFVGRSLEWRGLVDRSASAGHRAVPDVNEHGDRSLERGRIASDVGARRVDRVTELRDALGAVPEPRTPRVPAVGVGGGETEHPRPRGADHDRRPLRPWSPRNEHAVPGPVVAPLEVDMTIPEEPSDDGERLLEPVDPVV